MSRPDPTDAPRLTPDPFAKAIDSLGELDNVPEGVAVRVRMDGPITPPYDEIGGALDRARRVSLKTLQVKTDGRVRDVGEAIRTIADELGYRWIGHPYAGRHEPDTRVQKYGRDSRLMWHLRALELAGLPPAESREIHEALALPEGGEAFWQSCDDLDARNAAGSLANLSGVTDGVQWEIRGPLGLHWPVFRLVATTPDGREVTAPIDLREYVPQHLARMLAE